MTRPPSGPTKRSAPAVRRERTDDEGDAPLIPAVPKPKPHPTLGAGARELPREADEMVAVG